MDREREGQSDVESCGQEGGGGGQKSLEVAESKPYGHNLIV